MDHQQLSQQQLSKQSSISGSLTEQNQGSVSQKSSSLLLETTAALLGTNPLGGGGSCSNSLNGSCNTSTTKTPTRSISSCEGQQQQKLSWQQPSPTVNTKEAYNIAQAMWGVCSVQKPAPPPSSSRQEFRLIYQAFLDISNAFHAREVSEKTEFLHFQN